MVDIIKQYWKAVLAIVYAIAVPLYFYSYNKGLRNSFDSQRQSSEQQIKALNQTIEKQQKYYDNMFEQYKSQLEAEETRHQDQIQKIQQVQAYQQSLLIQKFQDPTQVTQELKNRYGLNGN